jgi:hypothetical protein
VPIAARTAATRRRATIAALAVSVASLAGAGSAAALPISLPNLGLTPGSGQVTTPGADLTTPGAILSPTVIDSLNLGKLLVGLDATAKAKLAVVVPSVALPTVSTPPVGSLIVRAPNGDVLLATPVIPSITTPSSTPSVKVVLRVVAKLKAKVKIHLKTPRIKLPGLKLKSGKIIIPAKTLEF